MFTGIEGSIGNLSPRRTKYCFLQCTLNEAHIVYLVRKQSTHVFKLYEKHNKSPESVWKEIAVISVEFKG